MLSGQRSSSELFGILAIFAEAISGTFRLLRKKRRGQFVKLT